jgi:hypothetical protein
VRQPPTGLDGGPPECLEPQHTCTTCICVRFNHTRARARAHTHTHTHTHTIVRAPTHTPHSCTIARAPTLTQLHPTKLSCQPQYVLPDAVAPQPAALAPQPAALAPQPAAFAPQPAAPAPAAAAAPQNLGPAKPAPAKDLLVGLLRHGAGCLTTYTRLRPGACRGRGQQQWSKPAAAATAVVLYAASQQGCAWWMRDRNVETPKHS